jgi:hypothetical protein
MKPYANIHLRDATYTGCVDAIFTVTDQKNNVSHLDNP